MSRPAAERRVFPVGELRARTEAEEPAHLVSYAAVFNRRSEPLYGGSFVEVIAPGAFTKALQTSDVRALWNHDSNFPLGREKSRTLKLQENDAGLHIDILPPETQYARDLMTSIDRGDVDQMSFGFIVERVRWEEEADGTIVRTILEVRELLDVSPVTFPAYTDTTVAVRSLDEWKKERAQEAAPNAREIRRRRLLLAEHAA